MQTAILLGFSVAAHSQTSDSIAEFDGSTLTIPAVKFGEKNLQEFEIDLCSRTGLLAYQSHAEEVISDQKTNSIFDGQKVTVKSVGVWGATSIRALS